jgi:hypothetical protein
MEMISGSICIPVRWDQYTDENPSIQKDIGSHGSGEGMYRRKSVWEWEVRKNTFIVQCQCQIENEIQS